MKGDKMTDNEYRTLKKRCMEETGATDCYMIKEWQRWGHCPTFKTDEGAVYYQEKGYFWTWEQLKQMLKRDWRPVAAEDQDWFCRNL